MIKNMGVGIDIVDVNRFRNIPFEKKPSFYKQIFHENEIKYCLKFKDPYTHFAGKFAVKECVRKCVGNKIKFKDIITSHQKLKPQVKIKNKPEYFFQISISHEKNVAIAIVLCEKLSG